jgi:hypothetical protein
MFNLKGLKVGDRIIVSDLFGGSQAYLWRECSPSQRYVIEGHLYHETQPGRVVSAHELLINFSNLFLVVSDLCLELQSARRTIMSVCDEEVTRSLQGSIPPAHVTGDGWFMRMCDIDQLVYVVRSLS